MLRFNASVNQDGDFILHFDSQYRDSMILAYAKAKGYQEIISEEVENQEGIPSEFKVTRPIMNPMSAEKFICKLIEQSISNVVLTPEIDKAVQEAKAEVIDSMKGIIPF